MIDIISQSYMLTSGSGTFTAGLSQPSQIYTAEKQLQRNRLLSDTLRTHTNPINNIDGRRTHQIQPTHNLIATIIRITTERSVVDSDYSDT